MQSIVQDVFERSFSEQAVPSKPENFAAQGSESQQDVKDEFGIDVKDANILVVGIGGAGNNCITRLTTLGVRGAETVALNTDAKHLSVTSAQRKILLGREVTRGLGAGGYPETGKQAAEETAADAGYVCWIQRQILLSGHLH